MQKEAADEIADERKKTQEIEKEAFGLHQFYGEICL